MKDAADNAPHDNAIRQDITVGDLVVEHPQLRQTLEQLGVDYCCGGKRPLSTAVEAAGRPWAEVEEALNEALAGQSKQAAIDWNSVTLSALADHIVNTHHAFMKEQLPRLDGLLTKVQNAHGDHHGTMLGQLRPAYNAVRAELDPHLLKEEEILFPAIKAIDLFMSGTGEQPTLHCGSVAIPIQEMEHEHDNAGHVLVDMRRITDNYRLPADACQTFAALYDGLAAMEADLHEHIHLENNILFPKSIAMEADMGTR